MTINYQQPYGFYNPYGMNPYQSQQPFMEQSYIENILRLKVIVVFPVIQFIMEIPNYQIKIQVS